MNILNKVLKLNPIITNTKQLKEMAVDTAIVIANTNNSENKLYV